VRGLTSIPLTALGRLPRLTKLRFPGPTGALIDNFPLVEPLLSVTEFTMTEDHLKLLRHAWVTWGEGEGYGAPGINPKKPYGNSYVQRDIARILDAPDDDWELEDGERLTRPRGGGALHAPARRDDGRAPDRVGDR
jgi:hypothetical protein